jgi:hypothetical protein
MVVVAAAAVDVTVAENEAVAYVHDSLSDCVIVCVCGGGSMYL